MKNLTKITITIISIILFSCSNNDEDPIIPVDNTTLIGTKQKLFIGGNLVQIVTAEYLNFKVYKEQWYDENESPTGHTDYYYNSDNTLKSYKNYNSNEIITSEFIINYDTQGRIIKTTRSELGDNNNRIVEFTYNSNNTISSVESYAGTIINKIFELNNLSLVVKEIVDGYESTVVNYSDVYPISMISYNEIYNITYHNSAKLPDNLALPYGEHYFNQVLAENQLGFHYNKVDRLVEKIESENYKYEYAYELNNDNTPSKQTRYSNGVKNSEIEYFYN